MILLLWCGRDAIAAHCTALRHHDFDIIMLRLMTLNMMMMVGRVADRDLIRLPQLLSLAMGPIALVAH